MALNAALAGAIEATGHAAASGRARAATAALAGPDAAPSGSTPFGKLVAATGAPQAAADPQPAPTAPSVPPGAAPGAAAVLVQHPLAGANTGPRSGEAAGAATGRARGATPAATSPSAATRQAAAASGLPDLPVLTGPPPAPPPLPAHALQAPLAAMPADAAAAPSQTHDVPEPTAAPSAVAAIAADRPGGHPPAAAPGGNPGGSGSQPAAARPGAGGAPDPRHATAPQPDALTEAAPAGPANAIAPVADDGGTATRPDAAGVIATRAGAHAAAIDPLAAAGSRAGGPQALQPQAAADPQAATPASAEIVPAGTLANGGFAGMLDPARPVSGLPVPGLSAEASAAAGTAGAAHAHPATQVTEAVLRLSAAGGAQHMTVTLAPAELGTIEIRLSRQGHGAISASVMVANPDTLALLQHNEAGMRAALGGGSGTDQPKLSLHLATTDQRATPPAPATASATTGPATGDASSGGERQGKGDPMPYSQPGQRRIALVLPDATSPIADAPAAATLRRRGVDITA